MPTLTGTSTGRDGVSAGYLQSCDFHVEMWGQSNDVGFADFGAAGGSGDAQTGSDAPAYLLFAPCSFRQLSATAPAASGAQTYNINTGTVPLGPYAAAGGNNVGAEQSLGRNLVKYGICKRPYIGKTGVASTSIPGHWAKSPGFPTTGTTLYQQLVANWNASVAETGRNIDVIVHQIGETDANTPARVTSAVADITAIYNNLRVDVPGAANAVVVIVMINPFASLPGDGDVAGYRAQQVAYVNGDSTGLSVLVDPFDIPLRSDPHYGAGGYWSLGDRILLAIRNRLFPGKSINLGGEPFAYYQADDPGATAQVSPSNASPRGAFDERENDLQILVATSYTQASTHNLVTAAGFLPLIAQFESVFTNHHAMSVWYRVVKNASMTADAAGNLRMPIPTMQFTGSTLNVTRIITIRGADPNSPFGPLLTGANNNSNTALVIPSSSTPTTIPTNALALILIAHTGNFTAVSSVTNSTLSALTLQRDSRYNPGAGTVGLAWATGDATGTSLNQTSIATSAASVNVGALLVINPAPATLTGASSGAAGASVASVQAIATLTGTSAGDAGASSSSAQALVTASGASVGGRGTSASAAQAIASLTGTSLGGEGTSTASVTTSSPTQPTLAGASIGARGTSAGAAQVTVTTSGASSGRAGATSGILLLLANLTGGSAGDVGGSSGAGGVTVTASGSSVGDDGQSSGAAQIVLGPHLDGASPGDVGSSAGAINLTPLPPGFSTAVRLVGVWSDGATSDAVTAAVLTPGQPVTWPRGMASYVVLQIVDQDGAPFDVDLRKAGNSVTLSVRQTLESDPVISVAGAAQAAPATYAFFVPSSATIDLSGRLVYDVWATRDQIDRQVVSPAYFDVTPRIRR